VVVLGESLLLIIKINKYNYGNVIDMLAMCIIHIGSSVYANGREV
jgi:hypothetical protein